MANTFGVGAVGNKIAIVHEVGDRLTKAEAMNLAANLVARSLTLKGAGDVQKELERFLELVGEVAEDESVQAAIRAELE